MRWSQISIQCIIWECVLCIFNCNKFKSTNENAWWQTITGRSYFDNKCKQVQYMCQLKSMLATNDGTVPSSWLCYSRKLCKLTWKDKTVIKVENWLGIIFDINSSLCWDVIYRIAHFCKRQCTYKPGNPKGISLLLTFDQNVISYKGTFVWMEPYLCSFHW